MQGILQSSAVRHSADPIADAAPVQRRFRVAVEDLRRGMFVAELDRPWLDTPFLLQGFIIDSDIELDTIRRHCLFVLVDPARSLPEVLESIRAADLLEVAPVDAGDGPSTDTLMRITEAQAELAADTDTATGVDTGGEAAVAVVARKRTRRAYRVRSDVRVNQYTRERFRRFVRETAVVRDAEPDSRFDRLMAWLRRSVARDNLGGADAGQQRALLPAGVTPVRHENRWPMQAELERALRAFEQAEAFLRPLTTAIRRDARPDLAPLAGVVETLAASVADNPDASMWVCGLRDEQPDVHRLAIKVAVHLTAFGRHLGFPPEELRHLATIGLLADVGKAKLPRALMDKPGMLNASEFGIVKEHVRIGLRLLRGAGRLAPQVEQGIAQHHERMDGSGYPKGRQGEQIGPYGRMAGIADSFAALTTPRAYANPLAPQDALMNLYQWAGTSFHAPLIEAFVQAIGVFPVGSLVEQSTGEVAAVLAHNPLHRLQPRLLVLTGIDKTPLASPFERDLSAQPRDERNRVVRVVRGLPSGAFGLKLSDFPLVDAAAGDPRG